MACLTGINFCNKTQSSQRASWQGLYIFIRREQKSVMAKAATFTPLCHIPVFYQSCLSNLVFLVQWSDEPLTTRNSRYRDAQTNRELKEALYYDIVGLFQRGKMWEEGIKLCKELAVQHELETFRYQQLSEILVMLACVSLAALNLLKNILFGDALGAQ